MAVIIGAGSSINTPLLVSNTGVISVNFGLQASIERLYVLGSFSPFDTTVTKQRNMSLTIYGKKPSGAAGTVPQALTVSTTCSDASSVQITFNPSSCGGALSGFVDTFYVTSYSYSKDVTGYGQESWSFITKPVIDNYSGTIYMLRGISTGQITTGTGTMTALDTGVVVDDVASRDSNGNYIESQSGSVSAGATTGTYEVTREIVATSAGGSIGRNVSNDGKRGQSSVSIPVSPIFL
jgi:hypothetical protein